MVKFSIYLNRRVFIMSSKAVFAVCASVLLYMRLLSFHYLFLLLVVIRDCGIAWVPSLLFYCNIDQYFVV